MRITAVLCGEMGRAIFGRDGGAGSVCVNCGFLIGGSGFAITALLHRFQYTKTWNCITA